MSERGEDIQDLYSGMALSKSSIKSRLGIVSGISSALALASFILVLKEKRKEKKRRGGE